MNYARIRTNDIANGEGIRTTLFVSGCTILCPGCQNYNIQKFNCGNEFNDTAMQEILNSIHDGVAGLSVLGGEPAAPENIETVISIMKQFKQAYPNKTIWCWTGFRLDLDIEDKTYTGYNFQDNPAFRNDEFLNLIDVLVDGRWEHQNYDPRLLWAGSTNQRVIDVKKTLEHNKIILYTDNRKTI